MAKRGRKDEAGRVASGKYCRGYEDCSSCQYSLSLAGRPARLEFLDTYGVPTLAFHEHKLELPSHLIRSRPREAEAGVLRNTGIGDRKQDQSIKNLASRTGSGVFRPPM